VLDINQLNMQFIKDPVEGDNEEQAQQRKANRLFQMVWSGVTKYLLHVV
jgi:hypothetical protein